MAKRKEPRELTVGCRCRLIADRELKTERILFDAYSDNELIVLEVTDTLAKVFWLGSNNEPYDYVFPKVMLSAYE